MQFMMNAEYVMALVYQMVPVTVQVVFRMNAEYVMALVFRKASVTVQGIF